MKAQRNEARRPEEAKDDLEPIHSTIRPTLARSRAEGFSPPVEIIPAPPPVPRQLGEEMEEKLPLQTGPWASFILMAIVLVVGCAGLFTFLMD